MLKPSGYDMAETYTGESEALAPGGYVCKIIKASEETTRKGDPMLVLYFDIAEGDNAGYYDRQFKRNQLKSNDEVKWRGVFRQLIEGNSTPYFKGLIASIENSNAGYRFNFDESTLKGLLFGGVFGREEFIDNKGEKRFFTKCIGARSVESIRNGIAPPKDKLLNANNSYRPASTDIDGFMDIGSVECPF